MISTLRLLLVTLAAVVTLFAPSQQVHALPYGCSDAMGTRSANAHCDSPSWTGQVRVVIVCRRVSGEVRSLAGPWVPAGGYYSWQYCANIWPNDPRWGYSAIDSYHQIR